MRSKTEEHSPLTHRCPFCGADTGTPCVTKFGRELEWPHSRRVAVAEPKPPATVKQALCCQCGQLRTYKDPWRAGRRHRRDDQWRRRWVGQLKCSHCRDITTHALLIDPDATYRDSDEREQRLALGDQPRDQYERLLDLDRLRRSYRQALPRNPNLTHMWWVRDEKAARQAGSREVATLCGGVQELRGESPQTSVLRTGSEYQAPDPVRADEYEDLDTGESWRDGDCVDCLRVYNTRVLERRRELLRDWLMWFYVRARQQDASTTERLIAALRNCGGQR